MSKQILGTSKMSSKFQVTIPKEARDRFKLDAEEILVFIDSDGALLIRKGSD